MLSLLSKDSNAFFLMFHAMSVLSLPFVYL
jgi:hypothetical protein